jgi:xanthine/uracil permease
LDIEALSLKKYTPNYQLSLIQVVSLIQTLLDHNSNIQATQRVHKKQIKQVAMLTKAFTTAAMALACAGMVSAQTFTECNPLKKSKSNFLTDNLYIY